jgi:RimJ/RimL family protein N-acetyltransferase
MNQPINDISRAPQIVIKGENLTLRPLQTSDTGLIRMHRGDLRVAQMTNDIPHPLPPGATQALLDRASDPKRQQDFWALDLSAHDGSELVGLIKLSRLDQHQSEVSYWVVPAYWNSGLASVFQDNPASARVLTNAGFAYVGDAEKFSVARNANVPTWTYLRKLD